MKGYKKNGECDHEITHFFHVLSMKFKYCRKCRNILRSGHLLNCFPKTENA